MRVMVKSTTSTSCVEGLRTWERQDVNGNVRIRKKRTGELMVSIFAVVEIVAVNM